jgi:predicted RNA-binding Zn-ribbon protein involved in translation (DUF1610 family)
MKHNEKKIREALAAAAPVKQVKIEEYVYMLDVDNRIMYARFSDLMNQDNNPCEPGYVDPWHIVGERNADDENRQHCKHIAKSVEAYANGEYFRCPECGEEYHTPENLGDKFKCPHCGEVVEFNDLEFLGIWDYMEDILDIDFIVSRDREYRSCKILVAWGGPNIYIDTASAMVKLYWWTEYAEYPLSYEARDAIDEWAEEWFNC